MIIALNLMELDRWNRLAIPSNPHMLMADPDFAIELQHTHIPNLLSVAGNRQCAASRATTSGNGRFLEGSKCWSKARYNIALSV